MLITSGVFNGGHERYDLVFTDSLRLENLGALGPIDPLANIETDARCRQSSRENKRSHSQQSNQLLQEWLKMSLRAFVNFQERLDRDWE